MTSRVWLIPICFFFFFFFLLFFFFTSEILLVVLTILSPLLPHFLQFYRLISLGGYTFELSFTTQDALRTRRFENRHCTGDTHMTPQQGPFVMLKPNPGNTQGHADTYRFFATPKKHGLL
jgi:hypothetical protein